MEISNHREEYYQSSHTLQSPPIPPVRTSSKSSRDMSLPITSANGSSSAQAQQRDSLLTVPTRTSSKKGQSSPTSTATTAASNSPPSISNELEGGEGDDQKNRKRRRRRDGGGSGPPSVNDTMERKQKSGLSGFFSCLNCCRSSDDSGASGDEPVRKVQPQRELANQPNDVYANDSKGRPQPSKKAPMEEKRTGEISDHDAVMNEKPPPQQAPEPSTSTQESVPDAAAAESSSVTQDRTQRGDRTSSTEDMAVSIPGTSLTAPLPEAPEVPEGSGATQPPAIAKQQQQQQQQQQQSPLDTSLQPPTVVQTPPSPMDESQTDEPGTSAQAQVPAPLTLDLDKEDKRKSAASVQPSTPIEDDGTHIMPVEPPVENGQGEETEQEAAKIGMTTIPTDEPESPAAEKWLLPPLANEFKGKKCLVLDLDETLVHSSFKLLHQADFTIPVEIEGSYHNIYVIKRPGVDQFMKRVGELYEVVVFTASVSKYGDPLLDQLDIHHVVHHRLFRDSCFNHQGNYVKDLSQLGRDLKDTIIIDNSPTSYIFHPQHALPVSSWFSDAHDNELLDLIPVLEDLATQQVRDVSLVLDVAL